MGVTIEELAAKYPRLYHMAHVDSWASVKRHGLLSTSRLLDLFEVNREARVAIERRRRAGSIAITHPVYGAAVIRDQKVLSEAKLRSCLEDCTLETWFRLLNERVFFWLNLQRLTTFMSAREYRGRLHTVLTIETEPLVRKYLTKIRLSSMNSGNTSPFAHPRGLKTFKRMGSYPFAQRLPRGDYYCVVELAVSGGVPDIGNYILRVAHARCINKSIRVERVLFERAAPSRRRLEA